MGVEVGHVSDKTPTKEQGGGKIFTIESHVLNQVYLSKSLLSKDDRLFYICFNIILAVI